LAEIEPPSSRARDSCKFKLVAAICVGVALSPRSSDILTHAKLETADAQRNLGHL